jgi:oligopeptide transport system substrate-binding protein
MRARFIKTKSRVRLRAPFALGLVASLLVSGGCFSTDESSQFYGRVTVPRSQEFRWSDGGLPRVLDPARAAAPPDTDAVRALYDGLTDYDPQTLAPVSADAYRWEASGDKRVWTFYLRGDARWSNGDQVTAQDYLRSWQRTLNLGDDAPHAELLSNLVEATKGTREPRERSDASALTQPSPTPTTTPTVGEHRVAHTTSIEPHLAVEAVDDHTLRVRLRHPDPNLPSLLAHTIFRPVHGSMPEGELRSGETNAHTPSRANESNARAPLVTNGAFRLSETTDEAVVLEREPDYRDASNVALDKVRFVNERDAESALRAYHDGKIDALTNANVEPAALKLLASYRDFERTTFGALTYYDFNPARPPFDDVRVREAFALALDRKRLSEDTLGGSTVSAEKFLPTPTSPNREQSTTDDDQQGDSQRDADQRDDVERDNEKFDGEQRADEKRADEKRADEKQDAVKSESGARTLGYDPTRARLLLAEAGYPGGQGFPRVRLLVNRNEQHRQVAEAVAEMWRSVLGVETEIEAKSWDEYETLLRAGEYDVAKRSTIMQTPDEEQSIAAMFPPDRFTFGVAEATAPTATTTPTPQTVVALPRGRTSHALASELLSESDALREVPAIPIYFASAFALVKPYVRNFDNNLLGVYSLKRVRLDTEWQTPAGEAGKVVPRGQ